LPLARRLPLVYLFLVQHHAYLLPLLLRPQLLSAGKKKKEKKMISQSVSASFFQNINK
jgi:hypothetical protein